MVIYENFGLNAKNLGPVTIIVIPRFASRLLVVFSSILCIPKKSRDNLIPDTEIVKIAASSAFTMPLSPKFSYTWIQSPSNTVTEDGTIDDPALAYPFHSLNKDVVDNSFTLTNPEGYPETMTVKSLMLNDYLFIIWGLAFITFMVVAAAIVYFRKLSNNSECGSRGWNSSSENGFPN